MRFISIFPFLVFLHCVQSDIKTSTGKDEANNEVKVNIKELHKVKGQDAIDYLSQRSRSPKMLKQVSSESSIKGVKFSTKNISAADVRPLHTNTIDYEASLKHSNDTKHAQPENTTDEPEEDPNSQSWIAITPYDEENLLHFSNLVKPRSLIEDGKFWKSVYHKFDFYADLLANLYEVKSGNQRDGKKYLDVLPISVLKQKLARSAGKMLRYADEFESSSVSTGVVQVIGGGVGILGGVLALGGLILAPFTAGGSLILMGFSLSSIATSIFSSAILEASNQYNRKFQREYMILARDETTTHLKHLDRLASILIESTETYEKLTNSSSKAPDELSILQDITDWSQLESDLGEQGGDVKDAIDRLSEHGFHTRNRLHQAKSQLWKYLSSQVLGLKYQNKTIAPEGEPSILKLSNHLWALKMLSMHRSGALATKNALTSLPILKAGGSLFSIASGIWEIILGSSNLKGSGTLSDRIRKLVHDVDAQTKLTFQLYDFIEPDQTRLMSHHERPRVLSGFEIHTCNQNDAQSDSPITLEIVSGNFNCLTNVIDKENHNDLEINQWDTYRSISILDSCSDFVLNEGDVKARLINNGGGAHCVDIINIEADYLNRPYYTCTSKNGSWSDYSPSSWLSCERSPDISKIDIYPCLSDYAGTDSSVKLLIQSGDYVCETDYLDNNGNDLARGYKSSYRSDLLGSCHNLTIVDDSLSIAFVHGGYDALCVGNVFIHGFSNLHYGRFQEYRCDIPFQETFEYVTAGFYQCEPFEVEPGKAVHSIKPHICDIVHAGSSTGFDYGVAFEFCDSESCCKTNYLDFLVYDELVRGTSEIYDQPGALGSCYGFLLDRKDHNVYFYIHNTNTDSICLTGVDLFSMREKTLYPFVTCQTPGKTPIWVTNERQGPFQCQTGNETVITQIESQICDERYAGSDSGIEMFICQDANFTDCCTTSILDKSGEDDFEVGDFAVYGPRHLGNCTNFPVNDNEVNLSIKNNGYDSICFNHVGLRTTEGHSLHCYMPNEAAYWVEDGKLDLVCRRTS